MILSQGTKKHLGTFLHQRMSMNMFKGIWKEEKVGAFPFYNSGNKRYFGKESVLRNKTQFQR